MTAALVAKDGELHRFYRPLGVKEGCGRFQMGSDDAFFMVNPAR